MANTDATPQPGWKTIGAVPAVDINTGSQPVKGHRVTFVTDLGNRGEAFVPDNVPVPAGAMAIIRAAATRVDTLSALSE